MKFIFIIGVLSVLCACQFFPATLSVCDKRYEDDALEFVYDGCLWNISKREGPDFDIWEIKNRANKRVAGVYWGGAPDVKYKKRNVIPQMSNAGRYGLEEVTDEDGYEALLKLPRDRYERLMYVHIFTPALDIDDLEKMKKLVRSVRVSE